MDGRRHHPLRIKEPLARTSARVKRMRVVAPTFLDDIFDDIHENRKRRDDQLYAHNVWPGTKSTLKDSYGTIQRYTQVLFHSQEVPIRERAGES
jgi:hypothetical protein